MKPFRYPGQRDLDESPEEGFETAEKVRVIGLGSAGANIVTEMYHFYEDRVSQFLETLRNKRLLDIKFMIADTDKAQIFQKDLPEDSKLLLNLTAGRGTGGVYEKGRKAVQNAMTKFEEFVKDATLIINIAGLGGGTGSGGLPTLAKAFKNKYPSVPIVNLAVLPRSVEGKKRVIGYKLLEKFLEDNLSVLLVDNDKLWEKASAILGDNADVYEIWQKINELIVESLFSIILSKCSVGVIHIDAEDLRKAFSEPGIATILYQEIGDGYDENFLSVEGVVKEFLNSSLVNLGSAAPKYLYIFFIAYRRISATFFDRFCTSLGRKFKGNMIVKQDYIKFPEHLDNKRAIIGIATGLPLPMIGLVVEEEKKEEGTVEKVGKKLSVV